MESDNMEVDVSREFKHCPNCGSDRRFFERLGKQLKDLGYARPEWEFCLDLKGGPVCDDKMISKIPYGAELPGYAFKTDICENCGTVYANMILETVAVKQMNLGVPGRSGDPRNQFRSRGHQN